MLIFDKDINLKNYTCSRDGESYFILPNITLYIQMTPYCNAKCEFCNTRFPSKEFDFVKLKEILDELSSKIMIKRIAITGGEPLLEESNVMKVIELIKNFYITLNTNAYNLEKLKDIYPCVNEVHISKHHYNNEINDKIMKLRTPTLKEIFHLGYSNKSKINCVWQRGGIEKKEDMIIFLEMLANYGFQELKNISLLPLNEYAKRNYIELTKIMRECEEFLNDGYLKDKDMCKCFEFMYVSPNGYPIKSTIRQTYNDDYSCVKQLVFDGKFLYDGFKKNNIIY